MMENEKHYCDSKIVTKVISSKDEAVDAVSDLMVHAEFDCEEVVKSVKRFVKGIIKPEFVDKALITIIDELADALPSNTEIVLKVKGREISIKDYLKDETTRDDVVSMVDRILGDDDGLKR
jgi:hypothetical protein